MGLRPPRLGDPEKVLEVTLGCRPDQVAPDVVITPFLPLKPFRKLLDEGSVTDLSPRFFYRGITGRFGGKPITIINTGVGPSRVGDCVSILALTPARRVLFAGAVGALHTDWSIGDWFLPTEAADGEGYTRYVTHTFAQVANSAERIDCTGGLETELGGFLRDRALTVREGRVFTVGSIAFESPDNLSQLAELGYDALEMELSAFYAAARHHALESVALTYVSDLPLRSSLWQEKSEGQEAALQDAWRGLPRLCLEFLSRNQGQKHGGEPRG